jgi:hypothetical protein
VATSPPVATKLSARVITNAQVSAQAVAFGRGQLNERLEGVRGGDRGIGRSYEWHYISDQQASAADALHMTDFGNSRRQ